MSLVPPPNFLIFNTQNSKQMSIVVDIDGLDYLTSTVIMRPVQYGDRVSYGDAGLTYGGSIPVGSAPGERGQRQLLELSGSTMSIQQTLEPESGRGSISSLSMNFVDKDSYMTKAVSSGPIVDEILGRQVRIWFGYANTQFPNDYFILWRGRVGQVNASIGKISMQFVDPNVVRRQDIFYTAQTQTSAPVLIGDTTISVVANGSFHNKVTGPSGGYDTTVRTFIKIDDEFIEYQQTGAESTGFGTDQFVGVVRGVSPTGINGNTTPEAHDEGATVDSFVMITGNIMDLSLKIMMSGWQGPYLSGQALQSLYATGDVTLPTIANGIILPANVDAVRDLGITVGDYIVVSGSGVGGNNTSGVVTGFKAVLGQTNRVILTNQAYAADNPTTAVISIRSQYDVDPDSCGCQLPGWEVDVSQFQYYKNTFLSEPGYTFQLLISASDAGKTVIENQLLMPVGAYSLTRQGKISVGLTKPPIADQKAQILSIDNVIDPTNIVVQRGVNNRKFFNEVDWTFDYGDDGNSSTTRDTLNSDSLNAIGVSSVLPIDSQGARTALGFLEIVANRELWLFNRYARASVLLTIATTLGVGNQIEVGDIVVVNDSGKLQIPNFATGVRNIGVQLFEVIKRDLNLSTGVAQLELEGGTGALINDRYATISPASVLVSGTTSEVVITESFGNSGDEPGKWAQYVGLNVRIHDKLYTRVGTTTFVGVDPANPYGLLLSPPLAFAPSSGDQIDICQYPNDTNPLNQALYKLLHAFIDDSVLVQSGVSHYSFNVSPSDAGQFQVAFPISVHDKTIANASPETVITGVSGNLITVRDDLTFTPSNSMTGELIGYLDGGQPYRLV